MPRTLVSIGGWCGPALSLGKLGVRKVAFPFDFSRVTLDGITHFVRRGFGEGFFPPGSRPYRPECVGMWVLFRGQHTAFAHFDLNDPEIIAGFQRKMERWDALLNGQLGPVTFLRTITAQKPEQELELVADFEAALRERNHNLDYRVAVCVHDQGLAETTMLEPMNDRVALWAVEYTKDDSHTLFDRSQDGYANVVAHCLDDTLWPPPKGDRASVAFAPWRREELQTTDLGPASVAWTSFPWRAHTNLSLIDGVASVGGTCTGVHSTLASLHDATGGLTTCHHCGNADHHRAGRPARTDRPFTDEEDELLLVHLYKIVMGSDKVEAVEQLAHELRRSAFEVICRLQYLTQSSTKITEGLGLDSE